MNKLYNKLNLGLFNWYFVRFYLHKYMFSASKNELEGKVVYKNSIYKKIRIKKKIFYFLLNF